MLICSGLFVVAMLFFGHSSASAASCALTGGNQHDYAGLVIETQTLKDDGSWGDASGNSMYATITTNADTETPAGNVVEISTGNSVSQRVYSASFRAISETRTGFNCPRVTNTAVILRGDGTNGSPTTGSSPSSNWALDCDVSKHSGTYQHFTVSMTGKPNQAVRTGTWSAAQVVDPANGSSQMIVMRYTPTQDWTLQPTSTVKSPTAARAVSITANPGQKITFFHNVKNTGPSVAKYQWKTRENYLAAGWADHAALTATVSVQPGAQNPGPITSATAPYTITIPSTATAGQKYCQDIVATHETGPGTAYGVSASACATVVVSGGPTVNISCSSSDILTGTATDVRHAGPYKVSFYYDSVMSSNQISALPTTGGNGSFSVNVNSLMTGRTSPRTFIVVMTGKDAAGADSQTAQASDTCDPPPCTPGSPGCPGGGSGLPCAGQDTRPNISLPSAAPNNAAPAYPSGSPNTTYEQDTPKNNYRIDSADDSRSGYSSSTSIDWSPKNNPTYQGSSSFTLNYDNYVLQYPYDHHDTRVSYSQQYDKVIWTSASSPSGYTCTSPDTGGGPGTSGYCYHTYTGAPATWRCMSGDTGGGTTSSCSGPRTGYTYYYQSCSAYNSAGTCTAYYPSGSCTAFDSSGTCTARNVCADGYTSQGSYCDKYYTYTTYYTSTDVATWSCNYGDTGGGTSSTCTNRYNGTPYYNYTAGTPTTNVDSTGHTYDGSPFLGECYHRSFSAHDPVVTVALAPNNESPSTATFQATIKVDFGYPPGDPVTSLHHPNQVTLNYTADYYYVPPGSNGDPSTGTPLPCSASTSGTIPVSGTYGASIDSPGSANTSCSKSPSFIPPVDVGGEICAHFVIRPTGDQIDENGAITINNGLSVEAYACSSPLVNEPYVHFFGNDIRSGGSFNSNTGCAPASSGAINTYLSVGNDPRPRGSSAQLGVLSIGAINQFASANLRGSAPIANTGLTFANTGGGFGGSLGGNHCIPDYYGTLPTSGVASSSNINDANGAGTGSFSYNGPQILNSTNVSNGVSQAIYVNGDVYISGNITYNQTSWAIDSQGRTNIPSLYLIAKGNIYIGAGVTQLDGTYIAQGSGSSGVINTCAQDQNGPFAKVDLYNNCSNRLNVTGSFIANIIRFRRTYSSLRHTAYGENPNSGSSPHDCLISGGGTSDPQLDCAAENFNFSPETYLTRPALTPSGGANSGKYDYIKSLSPVL